jgi:hypothetical protein
MQTIGINPILSSCVGFAANVMSVGNAVSVVKLGVVRYAEDVSALKRDPREFCFEPSAFRISEGAGNAGPAAPAALCAK